MATTDGRHARSERTRTAVAEAMLNCLEAGALRPSAKEVAEAANVSIRAVFRHFENMEALLEIASELQIERVMRELPPLVLAGSLRERIGGIVRRTTHGYELAAPVRRCSIGYLPGTMAAPTCYALKIPIKPGQQMRRWRQFTRGLTGWGLRATNRRSASQPKASATLRSPRNLSKKVRLTVVFWMMPNYRRFVLNVSRPAPRLGHLGAT